MTNVTEEEKRGDDEEESHADEIDSETEEPGPAAAPTKVAAGGNDDEDDEDDGGEDNMDDDTRQSDSLKQPLLILKKEITGKWPSGLEVSKSVTIANGRLVQIPQVWDKAYPRTHLGKAIILADQAIPEELQPSTIPNEGTLDTKTHA